MSASSARVLCLGHDPPPALLEAHLVCTRFDDVSQLEAALRAAGGGGRDLVILGPDLPDVHSIAARVRGVSSRAVIVVCCAPDDEASAQAKLAGAAVASPIELVATGDGELAALRRLVEVARLQSRLEQRDQSLRTSKQRLRSEIEERLLTERELLEARAAAKSASQIKAGFLANISHEIRTPMNGVIGMTHLLSETALDEQQREYVNTIQECGAHLLGLVDDILDFSRLEEGKLDLEPTSVDIRRLLEESLDTAAGLAREKGIDLQLLVEDDVAGTLLIDERRLAQIATNLLSNAVKFTTAGEVVMWVSSRPLDDQRVELRVEVRDSGIGIEEGELDRLFEPFTQADPSATRRHGGTGLGLTICRSLAALMSGAIEAESVLGSGSTFALVIPAPVVSRRSPTGRRERASASDLSRGTRALLIDDNPTRREVLRIMLERWGIVVVETGEAAQALEWSERLGTQLDMVLLDHELTTTDAIDLAKRLESAAPTLPIMLLSHDARASNMLGERASTVLKPAHAARLYDAVVHALSMAPRTARVSSQPAEGPPPGRPLRILIAEDSTVNRRVLELLLDGLGYPRHTAVPDGKAAVEAVKTGDFDLVLMDIQMPEMDGLTATRHIRAQLGSAIPIVAVTAHSQPEHRDKALAAGMDGHLPKPIDREALAALIAHYDEAASAPSVLDAAAIQQLVRTARGDTRFVQELVSTFERESAAQLARMRAANDSGDRAQVCSIGSTLRGSSGSLGALRVQALATELVASAERGEAIEPSRFEAVDSSLREAWVALREALQ